VALLQQLEQLFYRDPRVRRAPQGEDLPQQHPKRPSADTDTQVTSYKPRVSGQLLPIPNMVNMYFVHTHTSLWCVYILSNRASGAIHLTGKRPYELNASVNWQIDTGDGIRSGEAIFTLIGMAEVGN
jgi:hypothetical protein